MKINENWIKTLNKFTLCSLSCWSSFEMSSCALWRFSAFVCSSAVLFSKSLFAWLNSFLSSSPFLASRWALLLWTWMSSFSCQKKKKSCECNLMCNYGNLSSINLRSNGPLRRSLCFLTFYWKKSYSLLVDKHLLKKYQYQGVCEVSWKFVADIKIYKGPHIYQFLQKMTTGSSICFARICESYFSYFFKHDNVDVFAKLLNCTR